MAHHTAGGADHFQQQEEAAIDRLVRARVAKENAKRLAYLVEREAVLDARRSGTAPTETPKAGDGAKTKGKRTGTVVDVKKPPPRTETLYGAEKRTGKKVLASTLSKMISRGNLNAWRCKDGRKDRLYVKKADVNRLAAKKKDGE